MLVDCQSPTACSTIDEVESEANNCSDYQPITSVVTYAGEIYRPTLNSCNWSSPLCAAFNI
jgi:hypothetical protein